MWKLASRLQMNLRSWFCLIVLLVTATSIQSFGQSDALQTPQPLTQGKPIERELKGGEVHSYSLTLQAGQFLNVVVEQKGIDVVVTLFDVNGKKVREVDSPNGTEGREPMSVIIEATGNYRIEIRSLEKTAAKGRYEAKIAELRTVTEIDKNRVAADKAFFEGESLRSQGTADSLRQATKKYETALPYYQLVEDRSGEATTLINMGLVYANLGEPQKGLEYLQKALPPSRAVRNFRSEAVALNNIGYLYNMLGEKRKALDYYLQALPLRRAERDVRGETSTLINIGLVYDEIGEPQKALEHNLQALPLARALGDKRYEALLLNNFGGIYARLGDRQKALEYWQQSLPLFHAVRDDRGEAMTLNNIGWIYNENGEQQKGLQHLQQALLLYRTAGDKEGEATTLVNIGGIYDEIGEPQKALENYLQALPLARGIGYRRGEATTLHNIGAAYNKLGDKQKALDYSSQALISFRIVGDPFGEASTFAYLFDIFASTNPRLAVFYGKLAVNNFQKLRSNARTLEQGTQQTFLKSVEETYRRLANAMLTQKRHVEGQQVLNAFKDQQFFDFGQEKQLASLARTAREDELGATFDLRAGQVVDVTRELDDFKRGVGTRQARVDETAQINSLEERLANAILDYKAFLQTAEKQFVESSNEKDKTTAVVDLQSMQTSLRETFATTKQNTTAVYTLVGEENFRSLIITPDDIKSVSVPIMGTVLNARAKQFWALLQSDKYDTTKLGKELYDIVFRPIEKVLPKGTKTILWSMDGNLRYIPMAALYDGKQYLVERYNNVYFTRADTETMTRAVSPVWTATAFGSTQEQTVDLLGEKISFSPLPGVGEELDLLFKQKEKKKGIFAGEAFEDAKFTQESMLEALKQRRPVVHIASHFSFRPGDEARSFLLMGDGTAFTLADMKKHTDMFQGVEMLTLSACNTAAQRSDANGREVDAFFELAQRLGANSVMASLWSVSDNSTPWLMREFYKTKLEKRVSKAEALRQAQLSLLKGKAQVRPATARGSQSTVKIELTDQPVNARPEAETPTRSEIINIRKQDAPLYDKKKHTPFAHPFYWSPFVLFGNWR
jgi:CHAT domain-containing protein/Tfp pilus assembly protein PilF